MSYSDDTDALVEEVETLTGKLAAAQEEVVRLKSELAAHTARIGTPSTTLERDDQYFPSPMSDYQYVPSPMSTRCGGTVDNGWNRRLEYNEIKEFEKAGKEDKNNDEDEIEEMGSPNLKNRRSTKASSKKRQQDKQPSSQ
jgi:hypothetical protein